MKANLEKMNIQDNSKWGASVHGVYLNLPPGVYHAHPALSSSAISEATRSWAHYKLKKEIGFKKSRAFELGDAIHCAILEPERFDEEFKIAPDCPKRSKEDKARHEAFELLCDEKGWTPIKKKDKEATEYAMLAFNRGPFGEMIGKGIKEVSVLFELDGRLCKCRFDALVSSPAGYLAFDVKTCQDARPKVFLRDLYKYNYDLKAAFYMAAASQLSLFSFSWLAVEKTGVYGQTLFQASDELLDSNFQRVRKLLSELTTCEITGQWPGYSDTPVMVGPNRWAEEEEYEEIDFADAPDIDMGYEHEEEN